MARDNDGREKTVRCSFCGKSQDEVDKLIAGPGCAFAMSALSFVWKSSKRAHRATIPTKKLQRAQTNRFRSRRKSKHIWMNM